MKISYDFRNLNLKSMCQNLIDKDANLKDELTTSNWL